MNVMKFFAVACDPENEQLCTRLLQEIVRHQQNKPLRIILGLIILLSVTAVVLLLIILSRRKRK